MRKKKDNGLRAVLCLAAATIVVGGGSIALSHMEKTESGITLDITGANTKIKEARQNPDGTYTVTISENGYIGEMVVEATYSADGQTLLSYDVVSHTETENIGTKVDEDAYKAVLANVKLPVTASGLDIASILGVEQAVAENSVTALVDGTHTAQTEPTETGDYNYVTITVEGGKVTGVVWDEITGGASKAQLSAEGLYVMKPIWKTQAESLGAYVVEKQTTDGIMNETGYTDAVTGVSIYVGGFVDLANKAIAKANGQDGTYIAEGEKSDNGDYGHVTVTLEGGKITNVVWDEVYGGASKAQLSVDGKYAMKPVWKTQAESLGAYVVEHQTTNGIMNETGYTDAISSVSIYVGGFVDLANKAIAKASTTLVDGTHTAQTEPTETGDYNYVTITVEDGKITGVVWDEITGGASKAELAENGQYVMVEGNPTWKDQSESLGAYVVANQSTNGILNETGYTDAVSGVSIYVGGFVDLANQAIAKAKATSSEAVPTIPAFEATTVDVVSGATFSSKAVLRAINEGFVYLRDFIINK